MKIKAKIYKEVRGDDSVYFYAKVLVTNYYLGLLPITKKIYLIIIDQEPLLVNLWGSFTMYEDLCELKKDLDIVIRAYKKRHLHNKVKSKNFYEHTDF